jgi:hypothetical protein
MSGSHLSAAAVRAGPACQRQCRTAPRPIGCHGWRCPNAPGGLKAVPTAPFRQPLPERTARLAVPRRCPNALTRAAARTCRFASPSRPPLSEAAIARSEPSPPCPKPLMPPSTPSCASECGRAAAFLAPPSTLIFSLVPVGRHRSPPCRRRPRSPCHPTPPSTPSHVALSSTRR